MEPGVQVEAAQERIRARRHQTPRLSLVVPVFNEAPSVALFVEEVTATIAPLGWPIEIVFINDGSTDATLEVIIALAADDNRVQVINLSRRFGKEAALCAGLENARGDVVIPIDVDLQDPPALIPAFIERWREGYDVVYGERARRDSDSYLKRLSAGWFYQLFNRLSPTHIPENGGDFRLLDRRVVDTLNRLPERSRFMKGLFAWVGYRSIGVPFERPRRAAGLSKWTGWRLWNFALEGLVSFSTVPLRVWSYIGALAALLAFAYGGFIIVRTLVLGVDMPGYASLLASVLFLGGLQLLSVGILGEYLGRVMIEAKGRPLYVIEGRYGGGGLGEGRSDTAARASDSH